MNYSFENRNDRSIRLTTAPIVNPPIAAIPTRLPAKRHCSRLMAFPRHPAGKTVVDGLNPGTVMRAAARPYFDIQDTCQVHPILSVINDGHGIFGLERTVSTARRLTATPNPAICQPASQPAGRISCHPADGKPAVDGIEFPDYDQSHLIFPL